MASSSRSASIQSNPSTIFSPSNSFTYATPLSALTTDTENEYHLHFKFVRPPTPPTSQSHQKRQREHTSQSSMDLSPAAQRTQHPIEQTANEEAENMDLPLSPPMTAKPSLPRLEIPSQPQTKSPIQETVIEKPKSEVQRQDIKIVTFKAPGVKPNVRIRVFDVEFLVHSMVLRLFSAYFRGLFYPEGKVERRGEGYTMVVQSRNSKGELGWGFKGVQEIPEAWPAKSPLDHAHLSSSFDHLFKAMYSKPTTLSSITELSDLVDLASKLDALPCLSTSLYTTLHHSPLLLSSIRSSPSQALLLATKTRNKLLFRESLILVLSTWQGWDRDLEQEGRIMLMVMKIWNEICELVIRINAEIFVLMESERGVKEEVMGIVRETGVGFGMERGFYEGLWSMWREREMSGYRVVREGLGKLLENRAVLGRDESERGFYCAWVEDGEFPWDEEEW